MLYAAALAAFAAFFTVTVLYLRAAHRLVEQVRGERPGFWRDALGSPEFVAHVHQFGLRFEYLLYLQPLLPFLRWVLAGSAAGFPAAIRDQHRRTRRLFVVTGIGFLITLRPYARVILGW